MADYELMPYDHHDLGELREIFTRCFGGDVDEGYFRWKYLEGPAGQAMSYVARKEGRIAAYYGVLPEHYMVDGVRTIVYQSMDTMTHPEHRGQGLFPRLAKATYARVQESTGGLHLIGYPGPTAIKGFTKRLGWSCLVEMKYHFVHPWSFRAATMLRSKGYLEVHPVDGSDVRLDAYFQGHGTQGRAIAKVIDKDVLAWRTFGHPTIDHHHLLVTREGNGIGMCIYRVDAEGRAFLLWLDVRHGTDMDGCAMAVLDHLFEQRGIGSVHTFLSGDPRVERALRRCGSMVNPFGRGPYSYRTPFIVLADAAKAEKGAYDIDRYWIQPITRDY